MDEVSIKTFTEAGRGRKQCPACNTYVGVRNAKCVCGHDFKEAAAADAGNDESDTVATYTEAGRGRKQCPACNAYVGVRNAECACGHEFRSTEATTNPNGEYAVPTEYCEAGLIPITTPSGACPVRLTGTDEASVKSWADRVQAAGRENRRHYTSEALRYFLWCLCDHDRDSAEYQAAVVWL